MTLWKTISLSLSLSVIAHCAIYHLFLQEQNIDIIVWFISLSLSLRKKKTIRFKLEHSKTKNMDSSRHGGRKEIKHTATRTHTHTRAHTHTEQQNVRSRHTYGVLYLFLDEIERIQSRHRNGPAFLPAWLPAVSWWSLRDEQSVVISAPSLEEMLSAIIWRKAFACKQKRTHTIDRSMDWRKSCKNFGKKKGYFARKKKTKKKKKKFVFFVT